MQVFKFLGCVRKHVCKRKNMLHVKVGAKAFIYTYSIHQEHTSTHIYILV